jgi:hypothetical protein
MNEKIKGLHVLPEPSILDDLLALKERGVASIINMSYSWAEA